MNLAESRISFVQCEPQPSRRIKLDAIYYVDALQPFKVLNPFKTEYIVGVAGIRNSNQSVTSTSLASTANPAPTVPAAIATLLLIGGCHGSFVSIVFMRMGAGGHLFCQHSQASCFPVSDPSFWTRWLWLTTNRRPWWARLSTPKTSSGSRPTRV